MRYNSKDRTIERNLVQKCRLLIGEHGLVKAGKHPYFRFLEDFYWFHDTNRQIFRKYHHRYQQMGDEESPLSQKRGLQG